MFCLFHAGTLSDSGRNSMSSVPTHSNSGSLNASSGPVSHSDGSSVPSNSLSKGLQPSFPPWVNGNTVNPDSRNGAGLNNSRITKTNRDAGSPLSTDEPMRNLSETSGGIRSPITTDESLIECLEQRLLEKETELQELQVLRQALLWLNGVFGLYWDIVSILGEFWRKRRGDLPTVWQKAKALHWGDGGAEAAMFHKVTTSVPNSCKKPASTSAASQPTPGQPTSSFHFWFICQIILPLEMNQWWCREQKAYLTWL